MRPRYQVSVYRTIGPLVFIRVQNGEVLTIFKISFEDRILVQILSIPGHCLLFSSRCFSAT